MPDVIPLCVPASCNDRSFWPSGFGPATPDGWFRRRRIGQHRHCCCRADEHHAVEFFCGRELANLFRGSGRPGQHCAALLHRCPSKPGDWQRHLGHRRTDQCQRAGLSRQSKRHCHHAYWQRRGRRLRGLEPRHRDRGLHVGCPQLPWQWPVGGRHKCGQHCRFRGRLRRPDRRRGRELRHHHRACRQGWTGLWRTGHPRLHRGWLPPGRRTHSGRGFGPRPRAPERCDPRPRWSGGTQSCHSARCAARGHQYVGCHRCPRHQPGQGRHRHPRWRRRRHHARFGPHRHHGQIKQDDGRQHEDRRQDRYSRAQRCAVRRQARCQRFGRRRHDPCRRQQGWHRGAAQCGQGERGLELRPAVRCNPVREWRHDHRLVEFSHRLRRSPQCNRRSGIRQRRLRRSLVQRPAVFHRQDRPDSPSRNARHAAARSL